ncbi:MAG: DoxX family membrane protein [Balneolaceae bacterium]|nr:DoxX family membrane protein [Balneolaceae bacterium]MBO6545643.1 DoxX family membrane protein [Balneolaceae bacterium]MBO6647039.1 DoxX family membrane protein [Balneolaceae bacterium]
MNKEAALSKNVLPAVTILRVLIGWHFLFEGVLKLHNSSWSAKAYLVSAETLTGFYQWLASDSLIGIVDVLNVIVLVFVGLALVLGFLEKQGTLFGIVLLLLYYFAHPAFMNSAQLGAEGNYWIINKNLIEAAALLVLYKIPTGSFFGLEIFRKSNHNLNPT